MPVAHFGGSRWTTAGGKRKNAGKKGARPSSKKGTEVHAKRDFFNSCKFEIS